MHASVLDMDQKIAVIPKGASNVPVTIALETAQKLWNKIHCVEIVEKNTLPTSMDVNIINQS